MRSAVFSVACLGKIEVIMLCSCSRCKSERLPDT